MTNETPTQQEKLKAEMLKPEIQMPEGFIGKKEVARRLNKGMRTVDYWMERGILPYYKIGRSVEFKWSEVESHLAQTCRVARAFHS
jgi:excisionase family DNA binding protein